MAGPLTGIRVVEFAGLGPTPFAAMMLSDMGADVVRIDRPGQGVSPAYDIVSRGRRSVELNLKDPDAVEAVLQLTDRADLLLEGFRPGVMERLGLGPDIACGRNPRLVYGRMTGWGQTGPLAAAAGHDINYIAITGALAAIGPAERPAPPLNLIGDYGGGALYLVAGVLAALIETKGSGRGQVIDCAMCDGANSLLSLFHSLAATGDWHDRRESNLLDGGAPYYGAYECADGSFIAVGALEPQFYAELCRRTGLEPAAQADRASWPQQRATMAELFRRRTRADWCALLEGTDACFAPVLTLAEAPEHPHLQARGSFVEVAGVRQAAPAPRFSRTPSQIQAPPPSATTPADDVLRQWSKRV